MAERDVPAPDDRFRRNREWIDWLARERWQVLRRIAIHAGIESQQADDIVQTALTNVLRTFPGPDEQDAVFAYTSRAVVNTTNKSHRRFGRKEMRHLPILEPGAAPEQHGVLAERLSDTSCVDPAEQVAARDLAEERLRRLAELPAEQRRALALSAAGYGLAEIAEVMGLSVRAVRKRIEKGNRALRGKR